MQIPRTQQAQMHKPPQMAQRRASSDSFDTLDEEKHNNHIVRRDRPSIKAIFTRLAEKWSRRKRAVTVVRHRSETQTPSVQNLTLEDKERQKRLRAFQQRNQPPYEVYVGMGSGVLVIAPGATRYQRRRR